MGSQSAFDTMKNITNSMKGQGRPEFKTFFPEGTNPQAIDLIKCMLQFHPNERYSVEDCLKHPYLGDFRGQMHEPSCERGVFDFNFEKNSAKNEYGEMSEQEVGRR